MARRGNYDLLGKFSWCIPDGAGIIFLLLLLLLGTIIGLVVVGILGYFVSAEAMSDYTTLISYPIMFIPPMIWASINSRNTRYRQKGMALDNANVKPRGWAACICMAVLGTMAVAIVSDYFQTLLPPMPAWLEKAFKELLNGNILINFICVSIFAPFFEEWLCRGMILRGLLGNGMKPVWAIVISAAFFAFIHLNPWQAIPAFLLGCLFGYVYYKTGSLKLTMLMHFTNNGLALLLSNLDSLEGMETYRDIFPGGIYWVVLAACVILVALVVLQFKRIPLQSSKGNCDETPSLFEQE